ncbi:MAG TPA: beta-propeller fold lactonase family protein [Terrimesophilobacter sp.]|nr:beta-propeller fold lactonase family protein [Terrimesophilobacter sp.]
MWVGSYTENMGGFSRGISAVRLTEKGLQLLGLGVVASSPSYLIHATVPGVIYAVDEGLNRVEAFHRKSKAANLTVMGGQATSGSLPCHLAATADWLYASNYGTGQVDVYPLDAQGYIGALHQSLMSTGKGPKPEQDGPHAHSTLAFGDTAITADLGTDRVNVYRWQDAVLGLESSLELPAGTGPRDFAVSPVAGKIFLLGELGGSVFVLGGGRNLQVLKAGEAGAAPGDHAAGLVVDPTGRFLYTALRGSNRIVAIDANTLQPIADLPSGGDTPRGLCIVGNLLLVANQKSGTIAAFQLDPQTGVPIMVGTPLFVDSPTCLLPDFS